MPSTGRIANSRTREPPSRVFGLRRQPGRLALAVFRVPLVLYRRGWGSILGHTFLLLVHAGRTTGRPHSTVAMVLRFGPETGEAVVCSGVGTEHGLDSEPPRTPRPSGPDRAAVIRTRAALPHRTTRASPWPSTSATGTRAGCACSPGSWGGRIYRADKAVREFVRTRPFVSFTPVDPSHLDIDLACASRCWLAGVPESRCYCRCGSPTTGSIRGGSPWGSTPSGCCRASSTWRADEGGGAAAQRVCAACTAGRRDRLRLGAQRPALPGRGHRRHRHRASRPRLEAGRQAARGDERPHRTVGARRPVAAASPTTAATPRCRPGRCARSPMSRRPARGPAGAQARRHPALRRARPRARREGAALAAPPRADAEALFGGCHLTRPIADLLTAAGFTIAEVDVFYEEGAPKVARRGLPRRRRRSLEGCPDIRGRAHSLTEVREAQRGRNVVEFQWRCARGRAAGFVGRAAMVDRYTEWADWTGWADESADRRPRQGTGTDSAEGSLHVAKVRVAGSNPVVRVCSAVAVACPSSSRNSFAVAGLVPALRSC